MDNDPIDHTSLEVALLERVARRDQAAFAEFYDRLKRPIYSLLLRMLGGNLQDAEEVLQDVFLEVWKKAGAYDAKLSRPFSWVIIKARSRALDRLRWRARRPDYLATEPEAPVVLSPEAALTEAAVNTPWEAISRIEEEERDAGRAETLRVALEQIPPTQQTPIRLAFFLGMTHPEIAQQLGQPLGTIKARIRRGMARMRSLVGPGPNSHD